MAASCGLAEATPAGDGGQTGTEFVTQLAHAVHVTVSTRADAVKAVEVKALVEQWRKHGAKAGGCLRVSAQPTGGHQAGLKGVNA